MLRHPGRLLAPGEFVPPAVVGFIGRQLDLDGDELADYAVRSETRHEHLAELRWVITVRAHRFEEEVVSLSATSDCGAAGAGLHAGRAAAVEQPRRRG